MNSHRLLLRAACFAALLLALPAGAQEAAKDDAGTPTEASREQNVARIGVAELMNQSRHIVDTKWAQSQLVRELKSLRKDKHSPLLIDAVTLDAHDATEALQEADKKDCEYVVTADIVDPAIPGEVMVGPGERQPGPQIIGNGNPRGQIAVDFAVRRVGSARNLAEGTTVVPASEDAITAASDAMRTVAVRVVHEIRKRHTSQPE